MSRERAVVIGGSIAGLLAARALTDRFDEVVLVERDRFPAAAEYRRGVPQARHAHLLLSTGKEALERLLPGIVNALVQDGAVVTDATQNTRWFDHGGFHCRFPSGIATLMASRPLLEQHVRARVVALPGVRALEGCDVTGLTASPDGRRVTGVRLIRRGGTAGDDSAVSHIMDVCAQEEEELAADLVIDASGRGSRLPGWLQDIGCAAPEREERRIDVTYASALFRRPPDQRDATVVAATPEGKRGGVILPIEGDRWLVTLAGAVGVQPPVNEDGFLAFAKTFASPAIYNAIAGERPLEQIVSYRFPANRRMRYDRLRPFPERLLVVGDALCSFNPVYGQGVTMAALEAVALQNALAKGLDRLSDRFFQAMRPAVDTAWNLATGADLKYPEIPGRRGLGFRLKQRYMRKIHIAARHDPEVVLAFRRVTEMLAPPHTLLHPRMVWRVLRGAREDEALSTAAQRG